MPARNPWEVLGVEEGASYEVVRRAFRWRVKQTHPDAGGDATEFEAVIRAYAVVSRRAARAARAPRAERGGPPAGASSVPAESRRTRMSGRTSRDSSTATDGRPTPVAPSRSRSDFATFLDTEMAADASRRSTAMHASL